MSNLKTNAASKAADKSQTEKSVTTLTTKQQDWRRELFEAVADQVQTGVRLLNVVLDARRLKVPVEAVKVLVTEAYLATGQVTEATAKKRGSDAATLVKVSNLPAELPGNLQRAADVTRKAEREAKGQQRAPKQPGSGVDEHADHKAGQTDGDKPGATLHADHKVGQTNGDKPGATLHDLAELIEELRAQSFDQAALDILAQMADLASDLADKMAIDAQAENAA